MIGKGKWRHAATAVALTAVAALAAGCSASGGVRRRLDRRQPAHELRPGRADHAQRRRGAGHGLGRVLRRAERGPVHQGGPEDQLLARDELRDGDPAAGRRASSRSRPATTSPTSSTAAAQQHAARGRLRGLGHAAGRADDLRHAESHITPLSQLKGKLVGVNAPDNIDYLLDVSVLKENGIDPQRREVPHRQGQGVRQYNDDGAIPFPDMAARPRRKAKSRPPPCPSRSPASPSRNTARSRWPT